ncbi:Gfo/Idh/MocA family oxidoreductase [Peribacillus cavernae]|uniref:Gfo/Idh/MocA family oxidoreductase n=1 Tax=Peribacillus cavernae TaxID=1674310 RepID=A0A433HVU9_9BACI|nr:Gfo/Idh/MocA family oxidoreductase [Peribacillus cavernae]MDQ0220726.1 putative dehydrogenase [Peribacillus cavernae]RUQ32439.1 Gfo/Idh/MocA family oxidoreductase [Peribacillus cavernae]
MRVIQVGAGFWGGGWASVIANSPWTELVALVDLNEMILSEIGDQVGIPENKRFTSLAQALQTVEAEAALVVVPPEAHESVAIQALEAGLHCMIEKPFAPSLSAANKIVEKAEEVGKLVMITQSFRFRRAPRTVKRLIEEGAVGKIESIYGRFRKAPPFTGFRTEMQEPLIVDMSIHHFDYIRGIFGIEPDWVRARSFNPTWSWYKGNASALVEFETSDGTMISYTGSWVSRRPHTGWDATWEIHGQHASILWDDNRVLLYPHDNVIGETVFRKGTLEIANDILEVPLDPVEEEERWGTVREFVTSVKENKQPETHGKDNLRSLGLVLAAVESTKCGGEKINLSKFYKENINELANAK